MEGTSRAKGTGLVPLLSLSAWDHFWQDTLTGSVPGKVCQSVVGFARKATDTKLQPVGNFLQSAAFLTVLALVVALGMRQFSNDKEGLALIVIAGIGLTCLGALLGGRQRYKASAIDALVLAYLGANVVAACASHYLTASLVGLAKMVVYISAYFLFGSAVGQSKKRMVGTIALLVGAGFLVSLYGLYQYKIGVEPLATWEDPTVEVKGTRIYSTLGNPNFLAGYLVPLVPISFSLAMIAAWTKRLWLSLPLLGVTAVIAVAVLLTGSRGGIIGLAGGVFGLAMVVGGWLWREKPKARVVIVLSVLALPVLFWLALHFIPTMEQRVMSIFAGGEHTSNRYRMNVWLASLQMFKDSWLFGVGPGNKAFELAYGLYMKTGFDALGTYCVPLEVAVEAGLLGLAAFGGLVATLLARAEINFYGTTDGTTRWILAGAAAALFGMMAHGLVDTVFYRPQVQLIFWLLAALIVKAGSQSEPT